MNFESTERLLREHPFVSGMTDEQVRVMAGCMKNLRCSQDQFLFREGDPADAFFLIRNGTLALQIHSAGNGTLALETVSAGDVLGWSTLFPPHVWHVDARALENVLVLSFDGPCLRKKIESDLSFGYVFTRRVLWEVHRRLERVRLQQADVYRGSGG
jgi:CRP/FNR family cyclic AMP-dependent transcriptional regulator